MTITTIIFDIGGVLVQTIDLAPRQRWERQLGLPEWGLSGVVFDSPPSQAAFVGQADAEDVWRHVAQTLKLDPADRTAIALDFWAGDAVNSARIALIGELHGRVKLGILSNAWHDMRRRDARRIDFELFDAVIYSCEEGVRKPGAVIYQNALRALDTRPQHTLFIDDFAENIAAAQALGIQTIHCTPGLDLAAAVMKALDPNPRAAID
jgi:epoxide hydrolase-like predicted phosphatase